jgi:hypothetical protein
LPERFPRGHDATPACGSLLVPRDPDERIDASGWLARARYNDATMPTVDYRMARRALLRDLRSGLRSVADVCDAHPELMRAARFIGEETNEVCPICESGRLRVLFYTYGKELKGRENGRVRRRADLLELRQRFGEFACYVVEVCTECSWNHLVRSYLSGYKHAG